MFHSVAIFKGTRSISTENKTKVTHHSHSAVNRNVLPISIVLPKHCFRGSETKEKLPLLVSVLHRKEKEGNLVLNDYETSFLAEVEGIHETERSREKEKSTISSAALKRPHLKPLVKVVSTMLRNEEKKKLF